MKRTAILLLTLFGLLVGIALTIRYVQYDGATVIDTGDGLSNGTLLFHPHGTTIGVVSSGAIEIWDVDTKQRTLRLGPDESNLGPRHSAFAWSPDGLQVVTSTFAWRRAGQQVVPDTAFMTWSIYTIADGAQMATFPNAHADWIQALAWSSTNMIALGYGNNTVDVWDVQAGRMRYQFQDTGVDTRGELSAMQALVFSPNGQWLAGGGTDGHIRIWSMQDGRLVTDITAHTDTIKALAVRPDGAVLASASRDHLVKLWTMPTGDLVREITGHRDAVNSVTFSPDGHQLATAAGQRFDERDPIDGSVRVWNPATGALIAVLGSDRTGTDYVTYSADGRMIAANGEGQLIKIWATPQE
jgi:WD40 repeat protein